MLKVREDLTKHNDSLGSKDGEGNGNRLQWQPTWCWSTVRNPMDRGAWWVAVLGDAQSRTGLSDFTFPFYFRTLETEMATHSSVLAWRISGTGEPGGMPSMGSHRVRHNWSDLAAAERREQLGSLGWCVCVCKSEHTWACVCIGGLMH